MPPRSDAASQDALALTVLSAVLDGYAGARLDRALVQGQGTGGKRIADSAGASYGLMGRGPQLFSLSAVPARGVTPEMAAAALKSEVERIAREGVSEDELRRVKTQWTAGEVYKLDSVFNQAQELGSYWANGLDINTGDRLMGRLKAVTAAQVQSVAQRYFSDQQLTTAVLVPQGSPEMSVRPEIFHALRRFVGVVLTGVFSTAQAAIPIEHWTHASGARVYLVASPSIPMLDVQLDFDGGSRRDPATQAGLANATAGLLSGGVAAQPGLPALDENQLSEAWVDLGAQFGAQASADRFTLSLRTLTEPDLLQRAVALAARQIAAPAWPQAVWQRDRERLLASLKEAENRPGTQAGRAFARAVYGQHPYGFQPDAATFNAISVADMQAFYRRHVVACRAQVTPGGRDRPRAGRRHRGSVHGAAESARVRAAAGGAAGAGAGARDRRAPAVRRRASPGVDRSARHCAATTPTFSRCSWATTSWAAVALCRA